MKRVLAITALLIGSAAAVAPLSASADDTTCSGVHVAVHLNVNGTDQGTDQCVPLTPPAVP